MGAVTVITSGNGGVGKSTLTAGLGLALVRRGRRVLLIDDIVTTGATLAECSRVLRTAGASDVVYAAFAAPRKQD